MFVGMGLNGFRYMIVRELLQQLNEIVELNPHALEMKVCGTELELNSKFVYKQCYIETYNWSENFNWSNEKLSPNKEEILVLK